MLPLSSISYTPHSYDCSGNRELAIGLIGSGWHPETLHGKIYPQSLGSAIPSSGSEPGTNCQGQERRADFVTGKAFAASPKPNELTMSRPHRASGRYRAKAVP